MDAQFIAFLSFTAILVATPGSTTAVVVRNALIGGRQAGLAAAAGAATANASHATAAGLGLAVVFSRWPLAMTLLTFAGAAYLAWLGLRSVYRVLKHPDGGLVLAPSGTAGGIDTKSDHAGSFRQGLTVNLLNPAIAAFYLVVVPSFLRTGAPRWYFGLLAGAHIVMAFLCHGAWAVALEQLRRWFHPPLARRMLEGATGAALIALAIRVLVGGS
jgi:threonine/homoserine/homoserine lactone efflux protein